LNFDVPSLVISSIFGLVGMGLFMYGKKQQRLPQLVFGLVLMIYPYFIPSPIVMGIIGVVLCGLCWYAAKRYD
jgi:ABC-type dipeptide/oligopeptide/nickel transport system permease component